MMLDEDLVHTVTVWPRQSSGYGSAIVLSPDTGNGARWTTRRVNKALSIDAIKSAPQASILLPSAVEIGDLIALGDLSSQQPEDVARIHEVIEYRETPGLLDELLVRRATARALYGQLWKTVRVYPINRVATGRSYSLERGAILYEGPGEVIISGVNQSEYAGARVVNFDSEITVPFSVNLSTSTKHEIEWDSPSGTLVFEGVTPLVNQNSSPFLQRIGAILRANESGQV